MTRASRVEHDTWSALSNSTAWDFDTMLEYYKKHENFNTPTQQYSRNAGGIEVDADNHGYSGPVHYARAGYALPHLLARTITDLPTQIFLRTD